MKYPGALRLPFFENRRRVLESATLISLGLHGFLLYCLASYLPLTPPKAPPEAGVVIELEAGINPAASDAKPNRDFGQTKFALPEKTHSAHSVPRVTQTEKSKAEKKQAKKRSRTSAKTGSSDSSAYDVRNAVVKAQQSETIPPVLARGAKRQPPVYPELARKRGQEGTVNVRCQVNSLGNVTGASIERGSGFRMLDEAALKAVAKWKFEPGKKDGVNIAGTVIVPVRFQLRD